MGTESQPTSVASVLVTREGLYVLTFLNICKNCSDLHSTAQVGLEATTVVFQRHLQQATDHTLTECFALEMTFEDHLIQSPRLQSVSITHRSYSTLTKACSIEKPFYLGKFTLVSPQK